ncbi:MAG: DUF2027 domain-containing protein [Bacteroidales bacterium]|nr:DUF2027 domain-containing protein [Bacteroidales bacterium]
MKFKKGDKVRFLNENDHGTVTRVLENGTVMVLNSDDFEVPARAADLILDLPMTPQRNSQPEPQKPEPKPVTTQSKNQPKERKFVDVNADHKNDNVFEILTAFVPTDQHKTEECDLDLYLINDSPYQLAYNYIKPVGQAFAMHTGILEPDTKELLETIPRMDITKIAFVKFQILFAKNGFGKILPPQECEVKLHAAKFFQESYYKTNDFFDEKAVVNSLYTNSPMAEAVKNLTDSALPKNDTPQAPAKKPVKPTSDKEVVDLHLVELIDDERGMTPKEMLDYQMNTFRQKMEAAIKDPHIKKVVFIHGKGNGTLKLEIRKELDRKYRRYTYQDASFEEYGGGATLVYVK